MNAVKRNTVVRYTKDIKEVTKNIKNLNKQIKYFRAEYKDQAETVLLAMKESGTLEDVNTELSNESGTLISLLLTPKQFDAIQQANNEGN